MIDIETGKVGRQLPILPIIIIASVGFHLFLDYALSEWANAQKRDRESYRIQVAVRDLPPPGTQGGAARTRGEAAATQEETSAPQAPPPSAASTQSGAAATGDTAGGAAETDAGTQREFLFRVRGTGSG